MVWEKRKATSTKKNEKNSKFLLLNAQCDYKREMKSNFSFESSFFALFILLIFAFAFLFLPYFRSCSHLSCYVSLNFFYLQFSFLAKTVATDDKKRNGKISAAQGERKRKLLLVTSTVLSALFINHHYRYDGILCQHSTNARATVFIFFGLFFVFFVFVHWEHREKWNNIRLPFLVSENDSIRNKKNQTKEKMTCSEVPGVK